MALVNEAVAGEGSISSPAGLDRGTLVQLLELGRSMAAARDIEELLALVTRAALSLVDADRGTLYIYNPKQNEVWSKIATELEIAEIRLPVGQGAAGITAATRRPVNIVDARSDPRVLRAIDQRTGYETRTSLSVPLLNVKKDLIGVLQVLNKRGPGPFTPDDERTLAAFGAYAAVCLENALMVEEARRRERLALVGRVASAIAQDMRNPLSIISGYAQLAAERFPEVREFSDVICAETERLAGGIGEFVEYVQGSDEDLTVRPYSMGAFFGELLKLLERDFELSGIRLEKDIQFDRELPMNRQKLLRACLNIASHAREALEGRGTLVIAARPVGSDVEVRFTDSGPGIPREARGQLFEPFAASGQKAASGLRLAIAKRIVEAHGGTLAASDAQGGKGTTFTILLPLSRRHTA